MSYAPANYAENSTALGLSGAATVYTSFGADGSWRPTPTLEFSGSYLYNRYLVDRGSFGQGARTEQHLQLMGDAVWPLQANLELAAGIGAQGALYGAAAIPVQGRQADYFDHDEQVLFGDLEAKVGYRPFVDVPLTVTAGASVLPYGAPLGGGSGLPSRLWGVGWQAGARYTMGRFAVEAGYHGQRVWGDDYQQSSDLLHGTIGYYFGDPETPAPVAGGRP